MTAIDYFMVGLIYGAFATAVYITIKKVLKP